MKKKIEELKNDKELQEIIEITKISKASKETIQQYEDKTRPIITSKDYGQEVKVMNYSH